MKKRCLVLLILISFLSHYLFPQNFDFKIPDSVIYSVKNKQTNFKGIVILPVWPDQVNNPELIHPEKEFCDNQTEYTNEFGNDRWVKFISIPAINIFKAKNGGNKTPAVVIYPGGGGKWISIDREGFNVARELTKHGITAIVVKYRTQKKKSWDLPKPDKDVWNTYNLMQSDVFQALNIVYGMADSMNVDKNKIGVMGFSAGC